MLVPLIVNMISPIFQVLLTSQLQRPVNLQKTKMKLLNYKIILALIFKIHKFLEWTRISKILKILKLTPLMTWFSSVKK